MAKRSSYQQRVIRNYYENQDAILLQRLGDLVTDLYLAEGQARARLWKRVATTLEKLKAAQGAGATPRRPATTPPWWPRC